MAFGVNTQFQIGIDRQVTLVDSNGNSYQFSTNPASLGRLISITTKPMNRVVENDGISDGGVQLTMVERPAHEGTIKLDRRNSNADLLESLQQALYTSGQNQLLFTVHVSTFNRDGSGQYVNLRYNNCSVYVTEDGDFAANTRPEITLEFRATTRVQE